VADVEAVLEAAHLKNDHVRDYVRYWAGITGAANIEVVSADDDARLLKEALEAGEILPAGYVGRCVDDVSPRFSDSSGEGFEAI